MNEKNIPQDLSDSLNHIVRRLNAKRDLDDFLEANDIPEEIDFNNLEELKKRAVFYVKLSEHSHSAGLSSQADFLFHQYHAIETLIHEPRWMAGFYSDELSPIEKKMKSIEMEHGLKDEEYWRKGDAPAEYQNLEREYSDVLDANLENLVKEYASEKTLTMYLSDKVKFEAEVELGRKSIFHKSEVQRLTELVQIYEQESEICSNVGVYFSAAILLATALEATLIILCLENRLIVRDTLGRMGLTGRKVKSKNPVDWRLDRLIEVCDNAKLLHNLEIQELVFSSKDIGHALRQSRNLVHPGRYIKSNASLSFGAEQFKDIKVAYILISEAVKISMIG